VKSATVVQAERFVQDARRPDRRWTALQREGKRLLAPSWISQKPTEIWRGCVNDPRRLTDLAARFLTAAFISSSVNWLGLHLPISARVRRRRRPPNS
jgi:hypothetical protein